MELSQELNTNAELEGVAILSDRGSGRAFVLLGEGDGARNLFEATNKALLSKARVVWLSLPYITSRNWRDVATRVLDAVASLGIKQVSFIGFGAASAIAQLLALREPKLVRSLVLVNGTSRPHPSRYVRWIDRLEQWLPLGMPLRARSAGFDSMSLLQRIRCPALLVVMPDASAYERSQAALMMERVSTAWQVALTDLSSAGSDLANLALHFEQVPVKCPQKNLNARGAQ